MAAWGLEIWIVHPDDGACQAYDRRFGGLPSVQILRSRYEELPPHDAFVTAGNAFGMMTAGIDAAVVAVHGESLMEAVQHRVMDEYLGEQPIGTAFLVETGNDEYPFVVHAPTMRVPGNIEGTDKVYSATWAAFLAVHAHNVAGKPPINTLVFPSMGTGFGGMQHDEAARQMAAAYRHYLEPPHRIHWEFVADRHRMIAYDGKQQVVR